MAPGSNSLLDSHRVVCPGGRGGGNSAREHILNTVKPEPLDTENTPRISQLAKHIWNGVFTTESLNAANVSRGK